MRVFSAVQSSDGHLYFDEAQWDASSGHSSGHMASFLYTVDLDTGARSDLTVSDASYNEYKPQLSHDGRHLAYFRQYSNRRTEIRILDRETGQDRAVVELPDAADPSYYALQVSRPNYAFTPDDEQLILWYRGKIHRVELATGSSEIIPFRVAVEREVWERALPAAKEIIDVNGTATVRWPSMSRDGEIVAFAAIGYVWVMDLETGRARRLTSSTDLEYMPALSPDGTSVVYTSFSQTGETYSSGRLMIARVNGGKPRELLAAPTASYLLPEWSQDGQKIAVIQEVESGNRTKATFGWTSAVDGRFVEVADAPASDLFFSAPVDARYVGFDMAGENLLFSYPVSKTEVRLDKARLDGSLQQTLAIGSSQVGGIVPAPVLRNLALIRRDGTVWVIPFKAGAEPIEASTSAADARRVDYGGGYHVGWTAPKQTIFSFGPCIYRSRLDLRIPDPLHISVAVQETSPPSRPIAFTGARLLTMTGASGVGSVIKSGTVVLDGRRISAVGPVSEVTIPSDAVVIDVTGKTIMPGLLDRKSVV